MKRRDKMRNAAKAMVGSAYVYGGTGKPCTSAYRKEQMKQYPQYAEMIRQNCPVLSGKCHVCDSCHYKGKNAFDCAQVTRHAAESAGLKLPSGATSQWKLGHWLKKGSITDMPRDEVCMVYRVSKPASDTMEHTGVYTGDGMVVDARGHAYGVIEKPLQSYAWTHYAVLPGMDEEIDEIKCSNCQ